MILSLAKIKAGPRTGPLASFSINDPVPVFQPAGRLSLVETCYRMPAAKMKNVVPDRLVPFKTSVPALEVETWILPVAASIDKS
jgi:hypothetical protein